MKQNRQTKMIAILALCVAVVGLAIGFAAFSNTLTIKSSATVTPDGSKFKMTIYGLNEDPDKTWSDDYMLNISNYNTSEGHCIITDDKTTCSVAEIDNENSAVSNLSVNFIEPDKNVQYYFIVKNESDYDTYLNLEDFGLGLKLASKTCVADKEKETSQTLVDATCEGINLHLIIFSSDAENIIDANTDITKPYKIPKDDYIYMIADIRYDDNGTRADGPFEVTFEDLNLDFSTSG